MILDLVRMATVGLIKLAVLVHLALVQSYVQLLIGNYIVIAHSGENYFPMRARYR